MRRRIWHWFWGHTVEATRGENYVMALWCLDCNADLGVAYAHSTVPPRFKWRAGRHRTIGPLRRVWEYLNCQFLGHDCAWEWLETRFDEQEERCQFCNAKFRQRFHRRERGF